jgi:metallopeptidase YgjP-like protein
MDRPWHYAEGGFGPERPPGVSRYLPRLFLSRSTQVSIWLLDPPIVDYVLGHVFCHTHELNPSPVFWTLVAQHRPEDRRRRAALQAAGNQLPTWALDPGNSLT